AASDKRQGALRCCGIVAGNCATYALRIDGRQGRMGVTNYAMKVEKGVTVAMRDGIRISLAVYRPDAPGEFPRLFAASPYQYEMDEVPAYPLFLWRETGPVEWYVGQGYAYVHADVRGSGQSDGEFSFMGLEEQKDYLELIAWIIKQP